MNQQPRPQPPTPAPAAGGEPTGDALATARADNDDLLATALDHIEATLSHNSHEELQRARQRSGE